MKRQIHTIDATEHSVGEGEWKGEVEWEDEEEEEEEERWHRITATYDAFPLHALQVAFGNLVELSTLK